MAKTNQKPSKSITARNRAVCAASKRLSEGGTSVVDALMEWWASSQARDWNKSIESAGKIRAYLQDFDVILKEHQRVSRVLRRLAAVQGGAR